MEGHGGSLRVYGFNLNLCRNVSILHVSWSSLRLPYYQQLLDLFPLESCIKGW